MGIFRGAIVLILTALIFIAFFASNLFLTFSWSLDYNHVEPYLKNLISDTALSSGESAKVLQIYDKTKNFCLIENYVNLSFEGENIKVPCEVMNKGEKTVMDYLVNETAPRVYYQNYNCSFLDCLKTEKASFVIVSENAKNYWASQLNFMLIISLTIFLLLILFTKAKHNAFILSGIMMIFSSLPFRQIEGLFSLFPDFLSFKILPVFFTESLKVFIITLIIGIILIALGIGLNLFKWGEKFDRWINSGLSKNKEWREKKESKEKSTFTKEEIGNGEKKKNKKKKK